MKFTIKLHAKHQRHCLFRPFDLNDFAGAGTTALAVLFLIRVLRLRPSQLPDAIATSMATPRARCGATP